MSNFTPLEQAVVKAFCGQFPSEQAKLQEQLATARVTSREFTGVGFFTEFEVLRSTLAASGLVGPVGWVRSEVGPARYNMEFMLYVRDGYAEMIEGYSFGGGYGDIDLMTCEFTQPETVEFLRL